MSSAYVHQTAIPVASQGHVGSWVGASILGRAVSICVLVLFFASPGLTQDSSIFDDSDWWSTLRTLTHLDLSAPTTNTQQGELASTNFEILSVVLDVGKGFKAEAKLGKTIEVNRGDAALGRSQLCYSSVGANPRVYLIFEAGGEGSDSSFYLFENGANWKGSLFCAKSPLISERVQTASGLHLGQTPDEVQKILGKPSQASTEKFTYVYETKKETSAKELEDIRRAHPKMSDEEIRSSYGFYFSLAYIEARFVDSKLTYLGVTKSETFP